MTSAGTTTGERRADALRKAAQAKRQGAVARAETAICTLIKSMLASPSMSRMTVRDRTEPHVTTEIVTEPLKLQSRRTGNSLA
jgi:hypothetical protein